MKQKVELLAPAGSFESLTAAIAAGADAIYIGGNRFGARAYAENLDTEQMKEAIDYAHLHGVSIYLTVNTLLKEHEIDEVYEYLYPFYCQGLDAVIVQDLGVLSLIKENFPKIDIHASTQMTITGHYGAKTLKEMGASRIVTARELSLAEISKIHQNVDIEIESFVHGALCYGYSGQCLMSSLIGGRSGNRGRCAQTCRLAYDVKRDGEVLNTKKEQHLLSLKDLCTLDLLPDIIAAGVYSLKIEGRMKSPRYTAGVVSIYRKYLDLYEQAGRESYQVDQKDKEKLLDLFDRGGFTDGFYQKHSHRSMVALEAKPSFRRGNEELFYELDQRYVNGCRQQPVSGTIVMEADKEIVFRLTKDQVQVTALGPIPQLAQKRPLDEGQVRKQIEKTGSSPFFFEQLEIKIAGDLFVPVQQLNELRRNGIEKLQEMVLLPYRREAAKRTKEQHKITAGKEPAKQLSIHVSLERKDMLEAVINHQDISEIYIDSIGFEAKSWKAAVGQCHQAKIKKKCFLVMPHIFRKEAEEYFNKELVSLKNAGFDGVVVRNIEEITFLKEQQMKLPMIFDYTLYSFNHYAKNTLNKFGAARLTLPLELNSREIGQLGGEDMELVAYGHLPMMVSASCIAKTAAGCRRKEEVLFLKDRKGKEMPVKNNCRFCYNTIYNSSPLWLADQRELVERIKPSSIRLSFTIESQAQVGAVLDSYSSVFLHQGEPRKLANDFTRGDFTRGHLKRGVE